MPRGRRRTAVGAVEVNPWQYGTPDLMTPVVIALMQAVRPLTRSRANLDQLLKTVLRAANAMVFNGATESLRSAMCSALRRARSTT